jgi:hypothetical protein
MLKQPSLLLALCLASLQVKTCAAAAAALYVAETLVHGLQDQLNSLQQEHAQLKAAIAQRERQDRQAIVIASASAKRVRTVMATSPGARITYPAAMPLLPNKVRLAPCA